MPKFPFEGSLGNFQIILASNKINKPKQTILILLSKLRILDRNLNYRFNTNKTIYDDLIRVVVKRA